MIRDNSSQTFFSGKIEILIETLNTILNQLRISPWIAGLVVLFQFFQLIIIMLEFDLLELPTAYSNIFYYFNIIVPYKLFETYSLIIVLIVLGICSVIIFVIVYGFWMIRQKENPSSSLIKFYGIFIYVYEYVMFLPIFGSLMNIYVLENDMSSQIAIVFMVITGIFIAIMTTLYVMSSIFFFNFFLRSKDAFARSPDLHHFIFRIFFLLMTLFDVLIKHNYFNIKIVVNFGFSVFLCFDFVHRIPYYNYTVTLFYLFSIFSYFWINLLILFTTLIYIKLVKDNILITAIIGIILFLWDIYGYKEYLFNKLISKDFSSIANHNHLEKKVRYFLSLIKNSKKNNVDELRLASIIQMHVESCKDANCICKHRNSAYDPRKQAVSDPSLPIFKDFVFLKNLLLSLIKQTTSKLFTSPNLNMVYILYLFEELGNFGMADQESLAFENRFKKTSLFTFKFCIIRVKIMMKKNLKRFNKQYLYALNKFENVYTYDQNLDKLK
jgi:hypothetical protein